MVTRDSQAAPSEAAGLWSQLREQLRWTMAEATFDLLLRGSEGVELEGHTLTVEMRRPHALPWLNERLMPNILRTAHMLADPELQIVFTVEEVDSPGVGGHGDAETGGNGDGQRVQQPGELQPPQEPDAPRSNGAIWGGGTPQKGGAPQARGAPQVRGALVEAVRRQHDLPDAGTTLAWTDIYIKLKVAFRKSALSTLKGAPLSVFLCLALHMNQDGRACLGIEVLMRETGYGRASICAALDELESLRLIAKQASREGADEYNLLGYAWLGKKPAPALYETGGAESRRGKPGT